MGKLRQDAWSEDQDQLLAETVLRHVREGSTQLLAFEEAGDVLERTSAACGFRWNAAVRKDYEKELVEAKRDRKQKIRVIEKSIQRKSDTPKGLHLSQLSLDTVIGYLLQLQQGNADGDRVRLEFLLKASRERINALEEKIELLQKENDTIREDYEQFVSIMNRARKLVAFNDNDETIAPIFTMERNGNLLLKEPPIS
ncbi:RsfA family transcriptional regulator [Paenisporosarcina cavernae]|uniref:RsfA family transcriptional regulator n=1 Tax=Paenisporosarcina cavernae TaxID=2320858 RepID=A0A385YT72_9BACL|nr:RsfA family transcriptional regulator [Paenisporosarcina cavernae]AYC28782.1 RsfA family transcriptional regulator [Paenisporosarcina cavernae]